MKTPIVSKNVFEVISRFRSSPFIVVEPGGNYGDYLIYQGTYKLFKLAGISYKKVNFEEFMRLEIKPNEIIYINGGGGLNDWWGEWAVNTFIKAVRSKSFAVIVGPSSVVNDPDYLNRKLFKDASAANKKVFLFCRENYSSMILKNIIPGKFELLTDHDAALNLDHEDVLKTVSRGYYTLYAIRDDKERHEAIKKCLPFALWLDPIPHAKSMEEWVSLHTYAKKIFTNRLHSSILGSILNKPTVLLSNNYHKNRAVWEYSLKQRNVIWKDSLESPVLSLLMKSGLYKRMVNSYKIDKFTKRICLHE